MASGGQVSARVFVAGMSAGSLICFAVAIAHPHSDNPTKFLCYLGLAIAASFLKIKLPGVNGTMSVNFLFVLLGVMELSFGETLILGMAEVVVQSLWNSSRNLKLIHVIFNAAQFSVGTAVAWGLYRLLTATVLRKAELIALMLVAIAYFGFNTLSVAVVVRLSEGRPILKLWSESYFWSFPYYLAGAAITALMSFLNRHIGWQSSLLVFPPVYLMYRSYRLYLGKLENEKRHAEQVSRIHLRTIEALALAIGAKDHTTHDHLQRVRVYAMELAKELSLNEDEQEALQAAAVLHDIGKLAVPEHIISKPGKLTPEEFEKMKVHPVVGAEILEQVDFPYPVVPIVHAHHEKWDGSGYPDGLRGEAIPIGARILAAVDCLDALASDRQYRRALPLDEAMARVVLEAGRSFDPRIVEILSRRYVEWEQMAKQEPARAAAKLSTDVKIVRGAAPAAGFAETGNEPEKALQIDRDFPSLVAKAREEGQLLFELSQRLSGSLSPDDILSILSVRIRDLVFYDAMAVYLAKKDLLVPAYVDGDNFRLFSSLRIPLGEGLSGWVATNNKPILNGNPSVEPGYLNDPTKYSTLRSALAIPISTDGGVVAVLSLYRARQDGFHSDDVNILLALGSRLGYTIENVSRVDADTQVTTDDWTGLPNSRSFYLQLDSEVARCRRGGLPLAIFICELAGYGRLVEDFGMTRGKEVLKKFATMLNQSCRQPDFVARVGQCEFAVIAPGLPEGAAPKMIRRLQQIAADCCQGTCEPAFIGARVVTAFYPENAETAEQLLAQADRRLCKLHNGRSQKAMSRSAAAGG